MTSRGLMGRPFSFVSISPRNASWQGSGSAGRRLELPRRTRTQFDQRLGLASSPDERSYAGG